MAQDKDKDDGENEDHVQLGDSIIDLIAQAGREQRVAALVDWATTLKDYFDSLINAGFTEGAALDLTIAFQSDSIGRCEA